MTDLAVAFAQAAGPTAGRLIARKGRKYFDTLIVAYTHAFQGFLKQTEARCATVKTILNQEASVPLEGIYVNLFLQYGNNKPFPDTQVIDHMQKLIIALPLQG